MKKIALLFLVLIMCITALPSCSSIENDPMELAKHFDDEEYYVEVCPDEEDVKDFADVFEVRSKGIYCIVTVTPEADDGYDWAKMGIFIFCDDNDVAEKLEEDLQDFADNDEDFKNEVTRCCVGRSGKLVFIGCEDAWEDME